MRTLEKLTLILVSTLATAACNGGGGDTSSSSGGGGATASGLPCDVDAILAANCRNCHGATPLYGAPMPLVTHQDLTRAALSDKSRKVHDLVGKRVHDDVTPMPPPPNARLDAADMKVLDDWIAKGAPMSSDMCMSGSSSSGMGGGVPGPTCTPDVHVYSATPYTIPSNQSDIYICYGIDITQAQKRHVTAFIPHIDNSKVVHHIVLYQADAAQPAGPGPCGGGLGRIVSVWAPGVKGFELPPEAGIPLEGTTHYALQIHYNNYQMLSGEQDASGFDLCSTATLRPNDADVLALGTMFSINVPAHGAQDETCDLTVPGTLLSPLHVVGSMPHMHKLGTLISTVNRPGGSGAPVDLGTRMKWDFNNQYWTTLNATVNAGDVVSTRCAWNNPGNTNVTFGENTENEMCFTFAMYYPKITAANWNWTLPASPLLTKCAPTP